VSATKSYAQNEPWGIKFFPGTLKIQGIDPGRWAGEHTILGEYIGWKLIKINSIFVNDQKEINSQKLVHAGQEDVVFTIQSPRKVHNHQARQSSILVCVFLVNFCF